MLEIPVVGVDTVDGRNPANQLRLVVYPVSHSFQGFVHFRSIRPQSPVTLTRLDFSRRKTKSQIIPPIETP